MCVCVSLRFYMGSVSVSMKAYHGLPRVLIGGLQKDYCRNGKNKTNHFLNTQTYLPLVDIHMSLLRKNMFAVCLAA